MSLDLLCTIAAELGLVVVFGPGGFAISHRPAKATLHRRISTGGRARFREGLLLSATPVGRLLRRAHGQTLSYPRIAS